MSQRQEEQIRSLLLRLETQVEEVWSMLEENTLYGDGNVAEAFVTLENAVSLAKLRFDKQAKIVRELEGSQ